MAVHAVGARQVAEVDAALVAHDQRVQLAHLRRVQRQVNPDLAPADHGDGLVERDRRVRALIGPHLEDRRRLL